MISNSTSESGRVTKIMGSPRESTRERYTSQEVPVSMGRIMGELNLLMPADGLLIADGHL